MRVQRATKNDINDVMELDNDNKESWGNKDINSGTIEYFQQALTNRRFKFFVLHDDELLVGFLIFHLNDDTNIAHIHYLVVKEEYRRQGYGRKFISIVEGFSPETIKIGVTEENLNAQLFLRSCGYKCTKIRKNYYLDENGNKNTNMYSFLKELKVKEVV